MKFKMLFIIVFVGLLMSVTAEGFVFDVYNWGMSEQSARDVISQKGKSIISQPEGKLTYNDKLMDKNCTVSLIFSPEKTLTSVTIKWKGSFIGSNVQEVLTKKYGTPSSANNYMHQYTWGSVWQYSKMSLDYSNINTTLTYSGPDQFKNVKSQAQNDKIKKEMQEF